MPFQLTTRVKTGKNKGNLTSDNNSIKHRAKKSIMYLKMYLKLLRLPIICLNTVI